MTTITLTDSAANKVRRLREEEGDNNLMLRVYVTGGGCSGFSYGFNFADEVGEDDQVFETHGEKVIIDPKSLSYLDGTELDFVKEGLNEGFKFNNPNVRGECGCGESFNI